MNLVNRRALHDYQILETFETGIVLIGPEVKSVRGGRMSLEGSFVKIIGSEIYLVNSEIFPYPFARPENYEPRRSRKLLMHKKEIISLKSRLASGNFALVPLECLISHSLVKLKIGLAKGKKEYQKREKIKRKDMDRDVERELRAKK